MENKTGDKTQPCGQPISQFRVLDLPLPILTYCWRSTKKALTRDCRQYGTFIDSNFSNKILGTIVLKADVKSTNNTRAYVFGFSKCDLKKQSSPMQASFVLRDFL